MSVKRGQAQLMNSEPHVQFVGKFGCAAGLRDHAHIEVLGKGRRSRQDHGNHPATPRVECRVKTHHAGPSMRAHPNPAWTWASSAQSWPRISLKVDDGRMTLLVLSASGR